MRAKRPLALFSCLGKCSCSWLADPKPPPECCPSCGGLYFKWVNYDEWRRAK